MPTKRKPARKVKTGKTQSKRQNRANVRKVVPRAHLAPYTTHQPAIDMPIGELSGSGYQNGGFFPAIIPAAAAVYSGLKTLQPIKNIDAGLQALGVRDKIRDKLNQSKLGSFLVKGADFAKDQLGIGMPQAGGHQMIGGQMISDASIRV